MIDKFFLFIGTVTDYLGELLPADIVNWLIALLLALLVLAGWRIVS